MELLLVLLALTAQVMISVLELCFLLHAVLSLFVGEENPVYRFVTLVIEPVVRPVRVLLYRMNWLQGTPFDFSYMIAFLLVMMLGAFLA